MHRKTSTFCLFELISEVQSNNHGNKRRKIYHAEKLLSRSKPRSLKRQDADEVQSDSGGGANESQSSLSSLEENQECKNLGSRYDLPDENFRKFHSKRLQEKTIERLKRDGVYVYCVNIQEPNSLNKSALKEISTKETSLAGTGNNFIESSEHCLKTDELSLKGPEKILDAKSSDCSRNPFRLPLKNKIKHKDWNYDTVDLFGKIYLPNENVTTKNDKEENLNRLDEDAEDAQKDAEDAQNLVESPTSSRYSPCTETGKEDQDDEEFQKSFKNSPEYLDFKIQQIKDNNALLQEKLQTLFLRREKEKEEACVKSEDEEESPKFFFPQNPLREKSLTPPIEFVVPPVPKHFMDETQLRLRSKYLNESMIIEANLERKYKQYTERFRQEKKLEDKYLRRFSKHLRGNPTMFPFPPQAIPPWCFFVPVPGQQSKFGSNQYSKTKNRPNVVNTAYFNPTYPTQNLVYQPPPPTFGAMMAAQNANYAFPPQPYGAGAHPVTTPYGIGAPATNMPYGTGAPAPNTTYGTGAPAPNMPYGTGAPPPNMPYGTGAPAPNMPYGTGAPAPNMPYGTGAPPPNMPYGIGAPAAPIPYGYPNMAGMAGVPGMGGIVGPGCMLPPGLLPTMAGCCPCPVKGVPKLRDKNKTKSYTRYTSHGSSGGCCCCCNGSCCC